MQELEKWLKYSFYLAMDDAIKLRLAGAAKTSTQDARANDREAFKNWRNISRNTAMPPRPSMASIPVKVMSGSKETEPAVAEYPAAVAFDPTQD